MDDGGDEFIQNAAKKAAAARTRRGADAAASTAGEVRKLLELDAEALARGEKNPGNAMTQQLKFYVKLGRQTGVHVSPSAYVNGLFADTSSGWSESEWHAFFDAARGK